MNILKILRKPLSVLVLLFLFTGIALQAQQAKYVFYFIGDGMGISHVAAAEAYLAAINGEKGFEKMSFSEFPVTGLSTTHAGNRFITGSAAAGTALATGHKTTINTIGMDGAKEKPLTNIAEMAKKRGLKVGIISSVSINHATPACFYAHQPLRNMYYEIALDLPKSGFDFFGGGGFNDPTGKSGDQPSAYQLAIDQGYQVVNTTEEFYGLKKGDDRVIATGTMLESSGALPYAIDRTEKDIPLEDFVGKAIEVLDNKKGFFIMCEEGKIDWASHPNDGVTVIHNVISLSKAVEKAFEFYRQYPDETLIVVTSDHETGGMALGHTLTKYESQFSLLTMQKMSMEAFAVMADSMFRHTENADFDLMMELVRENFGLTDALLTDFDKQRLQEAFLVMTGQMDMSADEQYVRYGGTHPVAVTAAKILNQKAGIDWTTWSHTAIPVPVFAIGAGQELFDGYYDNTDIPKKISRAMGMKEAEVHFN
ncbi:MAG: alkaline phosphatase [Bacteroidales bacterium]